MALTQSDWNDFAQKAIFAKIQEALIVATTAHAVIVGNFVKQLVRREVIGSTNLPAHEFDYSNIELWLLGSPLLIIETINRTLKDADLEAIGYTVRHPSDIFSRFDCHFYVFGTKVARFSFIMGDKFPFEDLDVNYLYAHSYNPTTSKWNYDRRLSKALELDSTVLKQNIIAKEAHLMPEFCQMLVDLEPKSYKYQRLSRQIRTQHLQGWKIFYKSHLWVPSPDPETIPDGCLGKLNTREEPSLLLGHWLRQRLAAEKETPPPAETLPEPQTVTLPKPSLRDQALTEFDAAIAVVREKFIQVLDQ